MRAVNGLSCFVAAWTAGAVAFSLDVDAALSAGGVLLLVAAALHGARRDDPLRRMFDAIPDRMPWSNVPRGRARHVLGTAVLAVIGLAWLVGGLVGAVS